MALSANVLYEKGVSSGMLEKVVSPILRDEGYTMTNYHISGSSHINSTLISIRSTGVGHNPKEILAKVFEKSKDLCSKLKKEGNLNEDPVSYIWLKDYNFLGEYSEPETAEKLFPALAVENGLERVEKRIEQFKEDLSSLGNRLTNL